jgi:NADPH2:quinone reductase
MKAIMHEKHGDPEVAFTIKEANMPQLRSDDVLIKVKYSGLNFADVLARTGLYDEAPKIPTILGYDVAGTVSAVGDKVTKYKIGDRVAALTRFGGYAEYAVAKEFGMTLVPEHYDLATSTALATQACTAYYCTHDCVKLRKGDKVLIQAAAGGVGSVLVQIAKHYGCEVFATASSSKQEFVRSLGADHVIDYTKNSFDEEVKKIAHKGIDIVYDSLGGQAFRKAMKLLRPGGRMICFGAAENIASKNNKLKLIPLVTGFGIFSPIPLLMRSKSIITVNMLKIADYKPSVFSAVFEETMAMAQNGIIKPYLGKIFPAEEFASAHRYLESRQSIGKIVMEWQD